MNALKRFCPSERAKAVRYVRQLLHDLRFREADGLYVLIDISSSSQTSIMHTESELFGG
jgi:uncharacterized secreted protein with C-terminal beta-propeller domain